MIAELFPGQQHFLGQCPGCGAGVLPILLDLESILHHFVDPVRGVNGIPACTQDPDPHQPALLFR